MNKPLKSSDTSLSRRQIMIGAAGLSFAFALSGRADDSLGAAADATDGALRPRSFQEFVGQRRVVENLLTWVEAAKRREATE